MLWKEKIDVLKKEILEFNDRADGFYTIELDEFLREIHVVKNRKTISGHDKFLEKESKRIKRKFLELTKELV